ncbi:hypothetical protein OMAG_002157 [Candidatus Omnitrophus magneticus]|uniref:Uncharacterized protein n=1 Tax=Candidatus Omnitrophus magneticus TaxID=1609969 RepID=A0A0F0CRC0_9BACT|nr:hypothetical protein OMAG_002157 [Candidatus Omnitrophus magneticus]
MGLKDRNTMKVKQKFKRQNKRKKLVAKGIDPNKVYYGKFYVGELHG